MIPTTPNVCEQVLAILREKGIDPAILNHSATNWDSDGSSDSYEWEVDLSYETPQNEEQMSILYSQYGGVPAERYNEIQSNGPPTDPRSLIGLRHDFALCLKDHSPYVMLLTADDQGVVVSSDINLKTGIEDKFTADDLSSGSHFKNAFGKMVDIFKNHYDDST